MYTYSAGFMRRQIWTGFELDKLFMPAATDLRPMRLPLTRWSVQGQVEEYRPDVR
jgi:hypothetical protein